MKEKKVCKRYAQSFKEEAVALITEQGYSGTAGGGFAWYSQQYAVSMEAAGTAII
jgi:transposase-like protein